MRFLGVAHRRFSASAFYSCPRAVSSVHAQQELLLRPLARLKYFFVGGSLPRSVSHSQGNLFSGSSLEALLVLGRGQSEPRGQVRTCSCARHPGAAVPAEAGGAWSRGVSQAQRGSAHATD